MEQSPSAPQDTEVKGTGRKKDNSTSSADEPVIPRGKVDLKELPPLPRVDNTQSLSYTHRFQGPLSALKIRVRLLEYPSEGGGGPLTVLEDRVFSWQEKVLSKREVSSVGGDGERQINYLYSYVDTDHVTLIQGKKTVVKKWAVLDQKSMQEDSEWEDVQDAPPVTLPPTEQQRREGKLQAKDKENSSEKEERRREAREREIMMRLERKREEAGRKQAHMEELVQAEQETLNSLLRKQSKHKRPHAALSSSLVPHTATSPKSHHHSKEETSTQEGLLVDGSFAKPSLPPMTRRTRVMERKRREGLPSQSMLIMVTVPHTSRKKELVVCRLKALPTSGVVTIKAPFGFRVIHANRQHVYRLSWELHLPRKPRQHTSNRPLHPIQNYGPLMMEGMSFEVVEMNEMHLWLMGEIVSATGFQSQLLCVHFTLDTPSGWTLSAPLGGTTHSSFTTDEGIAHFSHNFSTRLSFSMDKNSSVSVGLPVLLLMVLSISDCGRIRYEGYGYTSIPSTPGSHTLRVRTWRLRPLSIVERMQDTFLDAGPSLHDLHAVHTPLAFKDGQLGNKLGLMTEGSGEVKIRLHVVHHTSPSGLHDQAAKLDLLEKMSHTTILKSVQTVIEAFHRARNKALVLKNPRANANLNKTSF